MTYTGKYYESERRCPKCGNRFILMDGDESARILSSAWCKTCNYSHNGRDIDEALYGLIANVAWDHSLNK